MQVHEEILHSIAGLGVKATVLSADQSVEVRRRMECFGTPGPTPLWERLRTYSSFQEPYGWCLIAGIDIAGPIVLLTDGSPGEDAIQFDSPVDLVATLGDTSGFEFYVTDGAGSLLLAFNHHDFLFGVGCAEAWIDEIYQAALIGLEPNDHDVIVRTLKTTTTASFSDAEFELEFGSSRADLEKISAAWPQSAGESTNSAVLRVLVASLTRVPRSRDVDLKSLTRTIHRLSRTRRRLSEQ